MSHRLIKTLIISITVTVVSVLVARSFTNSPNDMDEPITELPIIELPKWNGGIYNSSESYSDNKTVVLFFSPDCDHCEEELEQILENRDRFNDIRWILITQSIVKDELSPFLERHPVDSLQNSVILVEDYLKYHNMFKVYGPPSMFVFNKNNELEHSVRGSVDINTIIDWLK